MSVSDGGGSRSRWRNYHSGGQQIAEQILAVYNNFLSS